MSASERWLLGFSGLLIATRRAAASRRHVATTASVVPCSSVDCLHPTRSTIRSLPASRDERLSVPGKFHNAGFS
jgi:hypothetical protein